MTSEHINAEIAAFVRCAWPVHRAVDVTATAHENVVVFHPDHEAAIKFSTLGNLHHETCHLIIERLSSEQRIQECAKEGICDAYKFLRMHENDLAMYADEDRDWFVKIDRFKKESIALILSASGDTPHDIIHGIPASRLLRRFNTLEQLRSQLLCGICADDITDPDIDLPALLKSSWDLWISMNGKSDGEKQKTKQQIKRALLNAIDAAKGRTNR